MSKRKILISIISVILALLIVSLMTTSVASAALKIKSDPNQFLFWDNINPTIIKTQTNGDISITGSSPNTITKGTPLGINVVITSTFERKINDHLNVIIREKNGQMSYKDYRKKISVSEGITKETVLIETDYMRAGLYDVQLSFPVQKRTTFKKENRANNQYEYVVNIEDLPQTPTPTPTPKITDNGDILVSGNALRSTILKSEPLIIIANIRNTFNKIIETKLEVQIFATNGQPIPFYQHKHVEIGANGATTQTFEFSSITEPGTYQVRISSPTLDGETIGTINEYSFYINVLPEPTPTPTPIPTKPKSNVDLSLDKFIVYPDYWCVGLSCSQRIIRTDQFLVDYTISNKGTQNASGTLFISTEGVTLRTMTFKRAVGETRSGTIAVNAYNLPSHATAWNYNIVAKVDLVGDTNIGNNIKNVFYLCGVT